MTKINLDAKYSVSDNVVAREIEGEIIIVPLTAGIGDAEDDLFSLNETGRSVWKYLDGEKSVKEIVSLLTKTYEASENDIRNDVTGLMEELLTRGIIVISENE
ncbi:MAG: PqqD family protein [Acidobacteriota bacterium]